jgi:hypothetical protein
MSSGVRRRHLPLDERLALLVAGTVPFNLKILTYTETAQ